MLKVLSLFATPLIVLGLLVVVIGVLRFVAKRYHRCAPDEALVVFGRQKAGKGFRIITGGSAFVYPILEEMKRLPLWTFNIQLEVKNCPNRDGVFVNVEATPNVKISSSLDVLAGAAERLLGKNLEQLKQLCQPTLEGLLRQIIGTLTIEEMIQNRDSLSQAVLNVAQEEMKKLGFQIDNFPIQKLWDDGGYIESLGKKRTAEVKRDAEIGEAEAKREATIKASEAKKLGEQKRLQNEAEVAAALRDLALKQAGFKKETETAEAEAEMAKALKVAEVQSQLTQRNVEVEQAEVTARIKVAEQKKELTEKELVTTVIKPAEANSQAIIINAEAQRQSAIIEAEGASQAAVKMAEGEAAAAKAKADADRVKLSMEGEGRAAAAKSEASAFQARGEAEAAASKANLLAHAEGVRQAGLAEAEALLRKNEAMEKMGQAAQFIVILEKLPTIIPLIGDAGQKIVGAAFEPVGQGLSRIDDIHIVDMGTSQNGDSPLSRFAMSIPNTVFNMLQRGDALGIGLSGLLSKIGLDVNGSKADKETSPEVPQAAATLPVSTKKEARS